MRLYCMVNKLKPERIADYRRYHETAHQTEWVIELAALRRAGAHVCNVYLFGDCSILLIGCESPDAFFENLARDEDHVKWQELMADFFAESSEFVTLEKVFDLNEQAAGYLNKS